MRYLFLKSSQVLDSILRSRELEFSTTEGIV